MNATARPESNSTAAVSPVATSLLTQAVALHRASRLTEAEQIYRQILIDQPAHFDSLNLLGVLHYQRGQHSEAVQLIDAALKVNPRSATAHNSRGAALNELKRCEEAVESYSRATELQPDYADAFYNRGNVLRDLRRYEEALADYERTISLRPSHPEAFNNRGSALKALKRFEEAIASYDQAIALKPEYAEAFSNRGNALLELRRFEAALESYDRAIILAPRLVEPYFNRAITLAELQRPEEASASYDRAIGLKPDYAEAFCNRGTLLTSLGRFDEAMMSYDRAIALRPDLAYLEGMYLHAKMHLCEWGRFEDERRQLIAAINRGIAACYPFQLLACPSSPNDQLRCAQIHIADKHATRQPSLWRGQRYGHARIRVAYMSSDFRDHPVSVLTAGLFERHDRTRFETMAIAFGVEHGGPMRERLKASFERLVDAQTMSDQDVASLLRDCEVDIAVDLNGFTVGSRPNILAKRPAPVQVNYLGYAGTMGSSSWDYIIADRFVIPTAERGSYFEQVVHLPDTFMVTDATRRISAHTPSRQEAGLPECGVVFCCFNNSFKITPEVFDVWMRLLRQIEGSTLWLSANASAANNLRREAEARGVSANRLIFASRTPSNEQHLARLRLADLFLDTLYYNAHTTACDALWAGVPVLTCPGETFASRVAGSLLTAIGLPELITHSLADYEALAFRLVRDPGALASLRQKLARNRTTHPLFDTARFTRHIETAYAEMWERHQRGEPPRSFVVAPTGPALT